MQIQLLNVNQIYVILPALIFNGWNILILMVCYGNWCHFRVSALFHTLCLYLSTIHIKNGIDDAVTQVIFYMFVYLNVRCMQKLFDCQIYKKKMLIKLLGTYDFVFMCVYFSFTSRLKHVKITLKYNYSNDSHIAMVTHLCRNAIINV